MPVRTKACSACRKKRIKCDGALPQCLMCLRAGKLCPGPLQGPLIVDMTAKTRTGLKRRYTPKQVQIDIVHATRIDQTGRDTIQAMVTKTFYATFLTHFTLEGESEEIRNRLTWFHHLPSQVTDDSNNALVLALQATAIAYGAIMSSHTALDKYARELYGTALRAHHGMLQISGSRRHVTIHAISTSVLLSFFEAMQATTTDAYRAHIYGAAKLIEMTGPGECAHGVLCQLFYHVRTQMLFVQLASDRDDIPISAKRILHDTLWYERPPLIQRIMCCIAGLANLRAPKLCADEQKKLHTSWQVHVDQLWNDFNHEREKASIPHSTTITENEPFIDAFVALTLAYFSSAHILLASYDPDSMGIIDVEHHVQLILDAAMYLDTDRNPIAFMRMATPLLLVALHGRSPGHRGKAIGKFKAWLRRSMQGISTLALDFISKRGETYNLRGHDRISCLSTATTSGHQVGRQ